jgi:hypothetical protein
MADDPGETTKFSGRCITPLEELQRRIGATERFAAAIKNGDPDALDRVLALNAIAGEVVKFTTERMQALTVEERELVAAAIARSLRNV